MPIRIAAGAGFLGAWVVRVVGALFFAFLALSVLMLRDDVSTLRSDLETLRAQMCVEARLVDDRVSVLWIDVQDLLMLPESEGTDYLRGWSGPPRVNPPRWRHDRLLNTC